MLVKSNNANFELYARFSNYKTFRPFYNFLCEVCERLRYKGFTYSVGKAKINVENKRKINLKWIMVRLIWLYSLPPYRPRPPLDVLSVSDHAVECSSLIKNIGVSFEESLSFVPHITATCKAAFFHLRNISRIRKFLTEDAAKTIIHSLVTSKLDYCNSILYGQPKYAIGILQYVQNCAARIIYQCKKYEHVTPLFKSLHWLHIEQRVKFKILVITFKHHHIMLT